MNDLVRNFLIYLIIIYNLYKNCMIDNLFIFFQEVELHRQPTYMEVYMRMHRVDPADGSESHWIDSWSADFVVRNMQTFQYLF